MATYNCIFKILRLECPALVNGAMYRLTYRRGNTTGATPPIRCDGGVLNVQMDNATALLHFKPSGVPHPRFYKKYLTFTVEEALSSRREVGIVEFDVASCLQPGENTCRVVKQANFRMAGFGACIDVQVVLYPEGGIPPSSTDSRNTRPVLGEEAVETIAPLRPVVSTPKSAPMKSLSREDGMLLLLSVEELIEKRGAPAATKYDTKMSETALTAKIEEMEKRINELKLMSTSQEILKGASREAAKAELETYTMRRIQRLKQTPRALAFRGDVASVLSMEREPNDGAAVDAKIQSVRQEIAQLHAEQDTLGKLQLRRDVTSELIVNLERLDAKEKQLSKLTAQKDDAQLSINQNTTPLTMETVRDEITNTKRANNEKQLKLREAEGVLAEKLILWAARLAAPLRQTASIQRNLEDEQRARDEELQRKEKEQRKQQLVDLFAPMPEQQTPAPVPVAAPPAPPAAPVVEQPPQRDPMAEYYKGLPTASDFKTEESVVRRPVSQEMPVYEFGSKEASEVPAARRVDPFSDLRDAFKPSVVPASRSPGTRNDMPKYNFGDDADDDAYDAAPAPARSSSMPKYDFGSSPNTADSPYVAATSKQSKAIDWNDSFDAAPSHKNSEEATSYEF